MPHPDAHLIRDPDLLAELERAGGGRAPLSTVSLLATHQRKRDEARQAAEARKAEIDALPREMRRRTIVREDLAAVPPSQEDLRHIHSVLAICGLPYDNMGDVRRFERRQGNMSLVVTAGELPTPHGQWQAQPLPYGPKARLILMHLCSEAIRQKSATIEIADTFTAFVRDMGFADSGGARGPLTAFKQQLNALAACNMNLATWDGKTAKTKRFSPIEEFEIWLSSNPGQGSLWASTLTFSPTMFDSLQKHALPVNLKAVRAFQGSARKLDLYFWLGYRLYNMEKPIAISWDALGQQFGGGYARERDFRRSIATELKQIAEVFPKLPIKLTEKGLILAPAGPEVLALPVPKPVKPKKTKA